jgi:hypothetical protein
MWVMGTSTVGTAGDLSRPYKKKVPLLQIVCVVVGGEVASGQGDNSGAVGEEADWD